MALVDAATVVVAHPLAAYASLLENALRPKAKVFFPLSVPMAGMARS